MRAPLIIALSIGLSIPAMVWSGFKTTETPLGPDAEEALGSGSSPDGRHYIQAARLDDGQCQVLIDGKPGPVYPDITKAQLRMTSDGKHWFGSFATSGYENFFVVDGVKQSGVSDVALEKMAFSQDGRHYAYPENRKGSWAVVHDGKRGPNIGSSICTIDELVLSLDGRRLAYDDDDYERGARVALDNQFGTRYKNAYGLQFSTDGKRFLYVAKDEAERTAVIEGGKARWFTGELLDGPLYSPDGAHLGYAIQDTGLACVVHDGRTGPFYEEIKGLTFSPDSRRLGYFAKQDETWYLVINDSQVTTIEDQDGPLGLVLEGRGGYAFSVFEGSVYRLAPGAGESNEPEQGKDYTWVEKLFLSPDGARVAYLARTYASRVRAYESWAMVIDGNEDPEFTEVFSQSFRFSPNSRHYAYVAASIHADELGYQVVLDGQPTQRYTGLVKGGPNFNSDGTLEFLAMRSDTLYKVVLSPDEK